MPSIGTHGEQLDLLIKQGSTFETVLAFNDSTGAPLKLIGVVARAQIRQSYSSSSPTAVFTTEIIPPNQVKLSLSSTDTANTPVKGAVQSFVWDLELEWPNGRVDSPLWGQVVVKAEVTK